MSYTVNSLPTWLDIVQRAAQEMGISGASTAPSTTVGQTGELKRVVDWCGSAYEEICKEQSWGWLWVTINPTLPAGTPGVWTPFNPRTQWVTPNGGPVDVGQWDLTNFKLNTVSVGQADQQFLTFWPWPKFKSTYYIRVPMTTRPYVFTLMPNGDIMFHTVLDVAYQLQADVFLARDTACNTDAAVPLIPDEYRMLVVWEAVKKYAGWEGDGALSAFATGNARTLRTEMEDAWLLAEDPPPPLV